MTACGCRSMVRSRPSRSTAPTSSMPWGRKPAPCSARICKGWPTMPASGRCCSTPRGAPFAPVQPWAACPRPRWTGGGASGGGGGEGVIGAHRRHQLMARMNPVVIAAVQGAAAGGGAALALAADILLMADDACLRFPFVRLGLIPDGGTAFLLQAKAGTAMALDLLLSGGVMAAAEAFACGLTRRVVPPDRLAPQARALAEELARLPAQSLLLTKSLMRQTWAARMPGALAHEADAFALVTALPGHAQAMPRMRPQTRAWAKENG